jgi:intein/homing endonuclease
MRVKFTNGSIFQIVGSDCYDSLIGTNPKIIVFSEYAKTNPKAWEILGPIVDDPDNGGIAIFISTPRGKNHFHKLFVNGKKNPSKWFTELITNDDTQLMSEKRLQELRDEGRSEEFIQQEYFCFPPGQFVMTSDGMIDIKDIKTGMLVISHTGRLRKVLETYERDYEGDLVKIKSYGSGEDILCTPNHPVRIYDRNNQSYEWKNAENIDVDNRLVFPKMLFGKSIITESMAKLIAWYICEGSTAKNLIQFTVRNMNEGEYVSDIVKSCGYNTTISQCETAVNVIVNDTYLIDCLKTLCGTNSSSKKIPFHLIGEHSSIFLNELIKGDGCVVNRENIRGFNESERWCFTTISKTLAYQVQLLCHSLCYTAGICVRKGGESFIQGRKINSQDSYCVQIGSVGIRKDSGKFIRAKYCVAALVNKVERQKYSGKVYNFKVQYDESYTINGRAVHNCSFEGLIEGSIYGKYVIESTRNNMVCHVPYDKTYLVHTAWDIGLDATSVIFFQLVGNSINVIDHYETKNLAMVGSITEVRNRGYQLGINFAPHDGKNRSVQTGSTFVDIAEQMGFNMTVIPNNKSILDGIEISKGLFPRMQFDSAKCEYLLSCLQSYHTEYDEKLDKYKKEPCHDWTSHASDAFRYMSIAIRDGYISGEHKSEWSNIKKNNNYYDNMQNNIIHPGFMR